MTEKQTRGRKPAEVNEITEVTEIVNIRADRNVTLTLTLTGGSFVYDGKPHAAKAVVTRNGIEETDEAGLTIDYADANRTPLATAPVDAGSYYATATYSDGENYLTVCETLIVVPAPLLAVAASATVLYGSALPAFTAMVQGAQNSDGITVTASSSAAPGSPVGNYPITPSLADPGGRLANYDATLVDGTLTVLPAPLVAVADSASIFSGDAPPALNATVYGIRNADSITATASTTATAASQPGTYPSTVSLAGLALTNYATLPVPGTVTVSPVLVSAVQFAELVHSLTPELEAAAQHNASAGQSLHKAQIKFRQAIAARKVPAPHPGLEEVRIRVEGVPRGKTATVQVIKDGHVVQTLSNPDPSGMFVFDAAPGEELVALVDGIPFGRQRI